MSDETDKPTNWRALFARRDIRRGTAGWREASAHYYSSPEWRAKRQQVLARSSGKCEITGCPNEAREIHHKVYRNMGAEPLSDLMALCAQHHDDISITTDDVTADQIAALIKSTTTPTTSQDKLDIVHAKAAAKNEPKKQETCSAPPTTQAAGDRPAGLWARLLSWVCALLFNRYVPVNDVAPKHSLDPSTIRRWISKGLVRGYKTGVNGRALSYVHTGDLRKYLRTRV